MGLFKSASNAGRSRSGPPLHSNIRGKISGPIPIPDEDFSMREAESREAHEKGEKGSQPDPAAQRDSARASTSMALNATREDNTKSPARSGPSPASNSSNPVRHTSHFSTFRQSTMSGATNMASTPRKKSTFRVAIGKLFGGRNKKQDSRSVSGAESRIDPPDDHHRSDPTTEKRDPTTSESEAKRSASLPVAELNRALRSHSVGPDDYLAIHSVRNSLQSDSVFLRRAATSADEPISPRLRDGSLDIIGLSPRPASVQGHGITDDNDPESIGRALSVDYLASRRRSRSLSQLNNISEGQGPARKRSEEIRYWRASHTPGPLSIEVPVPGEEEPAIAEPVDMTPEVYDDAQSTQTPEPFDFGSIHSMRVTKAASLEERVIALEVQNQKLERLVSQLFQVVPGIDQYSHTRSHVVLPTDCAATNSVNIETSSQNLLDDADVLSPKSSVSEHSNIAFEDENTFIGSIRPSIGELPRPISNVTIRGATSLPSLSRDASSAFTAHQYEALNVLLDAERAARHGLEVRVAKLTQIVDNMCGTRQGLDGRRSGAYRNISRFDYDDDDNESTDLPSESIDTTSDILETRWREQGDHIFDEVAEDEEDEDARKRAARTLSLGRLTLGKPRHPQQPENGLQI
ncbi:hypothetical protein F4777DRAFT_429754 [Nemania sp. FL0916]|nr:hypothetical protein F4777DRAFT_429754 [Nemania sp. FL0916]